VSRIRLAVVGAGHLGRIHARLARVLDGVDLVAVVDSDPDTGRQVAGQVGSLALTDHLALIGQVDAAIVATPTAAHHRVAVDLLGAGIHVLVEKPLAASLSQADEMVAAARPAGRVLQVGHVERFNPAWDVAKPKIRDARYIEAVRTSGYTFRSTDIGVVLDLMIHDLDLVLSVVRSPLRDVRALGISVFGRHEDMAHARLEFENGCIVNLSASRTSFVRQRTMQLFCDCAYWSIDFTTAEVHCVHPDQRLLQYRVDPDSLSPEEKVDLRQNLFVDVMPLRQANLPPRNAIGEEQQDFIDSIRQGRAPRVTGQQGRQAVAVATSILEQIANHRWRGHVDGPVGPMALPSLSPSGLPSHPVDVPWTRKAG